MQTVRRFWNQTKWRATIARLPTAPDGRRLLHIGCGEINASGFINLDARRFRHVHFISRDLLDLTFIPAEELNLIYMSHILEHVPHQKVVSVLRQCMTRLKPGGVCRVSVPDFDLILAVYENTGRSILAVLGPLMGGQDYQYNFHYGAFNRQWLQECFERAGFVNVQSWNPASVSDHDFEDWSGRCFAYEGTEYPISLNLQAQKP